MCTQKNKTPRTLAKEIFEFPEKINIDGIRNKKEICEQGIDAMFPGSSPSSLRNIRYLKYLLNSLIEGNYESRRERMEQFLEYIKNISSFQIIVEEEENENKKRLPAKPRIQLNKCFSLKIKLPSSDINGIVLFSVHPVFAVVEFIFPNPYNIDMVPSGETFGISNLRATYPCGERKIIGVLSSQRFDLPFEYLLRLNDYNCHIEFLEKIVKRIQDGSVTVGMTPLKILREETQ